MRKHCQHGRMPRTQKFSRGFTLVEMVTVVIILAILAAIAIPNYGNVVDDASNSADAGVAGAVAAAAANHAAACRGALTTNYCTNGVSTLGCATAGNLLNPAVTTEEDTGPKNCKYKTAKFTIP